MNKLPHLRAAILDLGHTQTEIAHKMGVTVDMVRFYRNGQNLPRIDRLIGHPTLIAALVQDHAEYVAQQQTAEQYDAASAV